MLGKLKKGISEFLLAAICLVMVLATSSAFAGQVSPSSSTSSSDRAYCVGSGYLYRTAPGTNNGQGICQFGNIWCDAHAFASGLCRPSTYGFTNSYGNYYPYYYGTYYPYGLNYGGSINSCRSYGGSVQSVHTPYGDVETCVSPSGTTMDLSGLYFGLYNGYLGNVWYDYASSFLNQP